ncbi:MAG: T9SS type A sorting domain-containing protein [Bacteroidota bacterium]|nr:T9SS type A sorting domain-containing protein [Bacteroidota bacterium]
MKKIFITIVLLFIAGISYAQNPQYSLILHNGTQVSSTVYEFDVSIMAISPTTSFELSGIQPIMTFNPGISAGTLTFSIVPSSSQLESDLQPRIASISGNQLRVEPRTPPGYGYGTIIGDPAKRVARFRITSTTPFNNKSPNIQWKNSGNPFTIVSAYVGTVNTDITNSVNHINTLADSPLPVELTSFTSKLKGSSIILNWKTATEIKNYGFTVERKTEKTEWLKIGFVKGNGNSNSPKEYTFNDKPFGESKYQYRLKQIDIDGKFTYYNSIEVTMVPINYSIEQNYPNPFNPSTSIRFQLPKESRVNLKIYNMLGQEVAVLINETMEAGFKYVKFDASKLSSGTYLYRIEAGEFTQTKKMVLIK